MDYDKIFEKDIDREFFYTNYPGNKLVVGKISLKNAIERLKKSEYYVLVSYENGEELPIQYRPIPDLENEDGVLFATINSDVRVTEICRNGGIQRISRLGRPNDENPNYLLGPGPETISLNEMIMEQYNECYGKSTGRSR